MNTLVTRIPVESLQVNDLVWVQGYLFRVLEMQPVFTAPAGNAQRHFTGQAVPAPNGNGTPGGGYDRATYSAADYNGMVSIFTK